MKTTMNAISETQCARFLYTKIIIIMKGLIYKNPDISQKARKCLLRFYVQKDGGFALREFHRTFEIVGGGGGGVLYPKNNAICVAFLYAKNNAISATFIYTKSLSLCVIFVY